jgi:hypothetical protein
MKNLNEYYNQIKTENSPSENDFSMLLNKVNTRTEVRENFYKNNNSLQKVKSPFFAWSFGFAGFAMAAFMFFVNINSNEVPNLALNSEVVLRSSNTTVIQNKEKISNTINLIDGMSSFSAVKTIDN